MKPGKATVWINVGLCGLLAASVALNFYMLHRFVSRRTSRPPLVSTATLPAMSVHSEDGSPKLLALRGNARPTVLYIISPSCIWCARNASNFRSLVVSLGRTYSVAVISLSTVGLPEYARKLDLPVAVYNLPDAATLDAYGLGVTPDTLVMGTDGTIRKRWIGAWEGDTIDEIQRFFGIHLHGAVSNTLQLKTAVLSNK